MKGKLRKYFSILALIIISAMLVACGGDTTVPEISLDGELSFTIGDPDISFDGLFVATDDVDGNISSAVVVDDSSVDYTKPGTYQVSVSVTDEAGNITETSFDLVVVNESVKPVIVGMVNITVEQGDSVPNYLTGVTATDNLDGDVTSAIIVDDSAVNYNVTGNYEVSYTVEDAAGNEVVETITVMVVKETVDPEIEGLDDIVIGLNGDLPNFLEGITAIDNFDGDLTSDIQVSYPNNINTSVAGEYTVVYTVTDAAGNTTEEEVTLYVSDITAPVIEGHRDLSFKVFSDPDFLWKQITVIDNIDGDLLSEIVIDDSLVNMDVVGEYELTYSATDSAGNTASVTVIISVKDYEAPQVVELDTIYYLDGDDAPVYTDYVTVVDNYDGDITMQVLFDDSTVDLTATGVTYTIVMTATDSSGNTMVSSLELVIPTQAEVDALNNDIAEIVFPTTPIEANLVLPEVGSNSSTITWDSLNDLRMTDAGKLLKPGINEPDAEVTLVATFTNGSYQKVVEFDLLVASKEETVINSKQTYDYIALGEEYVSFDGTLDAYYEEYGNVPFVDIIDLLAVSDGAIQYDIITYSYTDPILTISYDIEYEDDDGVLQTETLVAYFDFAENTVTSPSSDFFGYYMAESSSNFGEGLTYIGSESVDPHEITFDLGYYGFDMVVYDDNGTQKYLVPFNIIELLLFGDTYYDVYFNHDAFYGTEHWQLSNSNDANTDIMRDSSFNAMTMPRDMKLAAYNYMAFVMDYYYGIKDFVGIETYYTELEPYIYDLIFSNDVDHYRALFEFVYSLDDPHSSFSSTGYYEDETYGFQLSLSDLGDRVSGYYQKAWSVDDMYADKYGTSIPKTHLLDDGKTAIIYIGGFNINTPDEFKVELDALPAGIENVIIDIANNGGGNSGAVWRTFGYMTEETFKIHFQNPLDGSAVTYLYESEYVAYDYNWFVLTSPVTFSAANMFANMAKELGIPVIGQNSSGGASSIQLIQPFGGTAMIISSNSVISARVLNEETGEYEYISLEFGVEVDYHIEDFLNDEALLAAINDILTSSETEVTE